MQQNKDINEMDDFSKLVRQKMKNHRIAVDADCWDNIEQQLKPKKSMRMALWTAASVVAVALLVLLFVPFKSSGSFDEEVTDLIYTKPLPDISRQKEKTGSADNGKSEKQNITIKKSAGSVRLISQQVSKSVSGNNGSSGTTQPVENSLLTPDTVQLANSGNPIAIADPDSGSGLPVADSVPSQEYKKINKSNKPAGILIEKTKKHDKWLLAASFSSGGGISLGGRDMDNSYYQPPNSLSPAMNDGGTVPVFTDNGDEFLEYDQLTDVNHSLPLSFGIAVRKDMSDRFALETGLVYTYLSSEFSKSGYFTYRAKQELHYLGIPVNVIVYLWNNPQWNVYASIGGMGEKGLRLNYMQNVLQKNKDNASSVSVNENIRGLQWSVNVSVGVTYKFYQNWGIYFEPRYSYYFDNSQPFSIRTENPKVFGISAGFRYEF